MNKSTLSVVGFIARIILVSSIFFGVSSVTYAATTIVRGASVKINWDVKNAPSCTAASNYSGSQSDVNNWNGKLKSGTNNETFPGLKTVGAFTFSCSYAGPPVTSDSDTITVQACGGVLSPGTTWNSSTNKCESQCSATTKTWGSGCTRDVALTDSGVTRVINDLTTDYTGAASYKCNNGTWELQPGSTCIPPAKFLTHTFSPTSVISGSASTFTWTTSNATDISISCSGDLQGDTAWTA